MRRRPRQADKMPELMISPMLDLIFLLLAFFIISTMYMTEVRTISIALPEAQSAETVSKSSSLVTVKKDGSCWLDDKKSCKETCRKIGRRKRKEADQTRIIPSLFAERRMPLTMMSSTFSTGLKRPASPGSGWQRSRRQEDE